MKHIYIYIWCSKAQIPFLIDYFVNQKGCMFDILVWCKTNAIPTANGTYLSNVEYCLMFREKGTKIYNTEDNVVDKSRWYISGINTEDKKYYDHPTIKPLELVKRHIRNSTKENDIVLDCFMGSGTTCVGAKELGRRYIGFEINEEYFNIAQDRINGITQKERKANIEQMKLF